MKKSEWKDSYLKIGDIVKVREGIMCPDFKDFDIGGWQGEVIEISTDDDNVTIGILWDLTTSQNMPGSFIQQGEEEGLDNDLMYLFFEEVELIKRASNQEKRLVEIIEIANKLGWVVPPINGQSYPTMMLSEVEKCMLAMVDDDQFQRIKNYIKENDERKACQNNE